jgi:hypothetical protein
MPVAPRGGGDDISIDQPLRQPRRIENAKGAEYNTTPFGISLEFGAPVAATKARKRLTTDRRSLRIRAAAGHRCMPLRPCKVLQGPRSIVEARHTIRADGGNADRRINDAPLR